MEVLWLFVLAIGGCTAYPELTCSGSNEVATKCMSLCPRFCNITHTDYECDEICTPGCDCKKDYMRNSDGECVRFDECETPLLIPECDKGEVVVPCAAACPKTICKIFPIYAFLCTKEKKRVDKLNENIEDNGAFIYECPLGYDPNNLPALLVSSAESTIIGIDFPHPTKYKRPEILTIDKSITFFTPFINKDEEKLND